MLEEIGHQAKLFGPTNHIEKSDDVQHGTNYLDENFEWRFLKWHEERNDSGIVVIICEAENVELATFDFSGRATNAIGDALLQKFEHFWPKMITLETIS